MLYNAPRFTTKGIKMLSIEDVKKGLQDRRVGLIKRKTGLSYPTIQGIRDGTNTNPTLNVLQRLSDYLEGKLDEQTI